MQRQHNSGWHLAHTSALAPLTPTLEAWAWSVLPVLATMLVAVLVPVLVQALVLPPVALAMLMAVPPLLTLAPALAALGHPAAVMRAPALHAPTVAPTPTLARVRVAAAAQLGHRSAPCAWLAAPPRAT